jgi:hypothetical protein
MRFVDRTGSQREHDSTIGAQLFHDPQEQQPSDSVGPPRTA